MVNVFPFKLDSLNLEGPNPFRSPPKVIPPLGPKPGVVNICGEDTECLRPRLCNIDGIGANLGDAKESPNPAFAVPVFKLNKLGFFLGFRGGGLINEGDDGSDAWDGSAAALKPPKLRARLFGFLNFLGDGEVIGLSSDIGGRTGFRSAIFRL